MDRLQNGASALTRRGAVNYRYLGSSGLLVSRICLGTMIFGNPEWGCDKKTSRDIIRRRLDEAAAFDQGYPKQWMDIVMPETFSDHEA